MRSVCRTSAYQSSTADVGVIYIQKGVELLVLEFDVSGSAGEPVDPNVRRLRTEDSVIRRLVQCGHRHSIRAICLLSRAHRVVALWS